MRKRVISALFYAIWFSWIGAINSAQATKVYISAPSKSLSWFPVHLAREKGFYSAEGLDVDYVIMKPQVAMQALIAATSAIPRRSDRRCAPRFAMCRCVSS